jgi:hypothetical protein
MRVQWCLLLERHACDRGAGRTKSLVTGAELQVGPTSTGDGNSRRSSRAWMRSGSSNLPPPSPPTCHLLRPSSDHHTDTLAHLQGKDFFFDRYEMKIYIRWVRVDG